MSQAKYYNLMLVPDGMGTPIGFKVKAWVLKTVVALLAVMLLCTILLFIFYGRILVKASEAEQLEKENVSLKLYKYKLGLLEKNMKETRAIVDRIARLGGIDFEIPELPPDSVLFANLDEAELSDSAAPLIEDRAIPEGLPLRGFMTRGYSDDSTGGHPGVDIAAAIGTPVLATAGGRVAFAGYDSTYGLMVVIDHADSLSTVYGHNSELLVKTGDKVNSGMRIALSGNTGKSTAPHLHYEIRENGKPINPLRYISGNEVSNK